MLECYSCTIFSALAVILSTLTVLLFNHQYKYWKNRNIPYLEPKFPLGNSKHLILKSATIGIDNKAYYDELKQRGYKFGGIFTVLRPVLVLVDPDIIKNVMTTDFHYFTNRGFYYNEKDDPISAHLFAIDGSAWKNLRTKLTPTFTSGKMKMMFETVLKCSRYMMEALEEMSGKGSDVDIREVLASFTTDVIGACAFGINCNSFKSPDAEFRQMGKNIFSPSFVKMIKLFFIFNMPLLSRKMGLAGTTPEISDFFYNVVKQTVKMREDNKITRPDFLQLLIDLKNKTELEGKEPFTMDQLGAQVFLFFIAGFDTSSTTMTFVLYELARLPEIQQKVREEILENCPNEITYDSITNLKYLAQVIDESMRMYPPVTTITRVCVKDYQLPGGMVVEKGTQVLIPTYGLHRDADYYPDPDKFDPERFTVENKAMRHHFTHIPFGEGPRNCIGLRFGLMQSKIGIISILKQFKLSISPKTKMPLHLDPKAFLLKSIETLYLKAEKI